MKYGWEESLNLAQDAPRVSEILSLVGNQRRLEILCHLAGGPMSVRELELAVNLSQSAMSQHLAKLRQGNLVNFKKDAQTVYYFIENDELMELMKALHKIYCNDGLKLNV